MKSEAPILRNIYARIDLLDVDFDSAQFQRVASIYTLGSATKHVTSISDFSPKNKKLVEEIGLGAVKELMAPPSFTGGGVEWDDLDDADFEEMLNTETPIIAPSCEDLKAKNTMNGDHFVDCLSFEG